MSASPDETAGPEEGPPRREGGRGRGAPKTDLASGERGARDYDETYGRGGGERFQSGDYPRGYPTPGRMDWRRALRAYVAGHDRGWEADRKYRSAEEATDTSPAPSREEAPRRHEAPEASGEEAGEATGRTEEGTRYGVPVAEELSFHRGASTWRDRLPFTDSLPRHGSRSPAGPGAADDRDRRGS